MNDNKIDRYRRIRNHNQLLDKIFLDLELEFTTYILPDDSSTRNFSETDLCIMIHSSIDTLFGESGYKIQFDILKFRNDFPKIRAYVSVSSVEYIRFRLALSLINKWIDNETNVDCQFSIQKACHCLSSLPIQFNICQHIGS